MAITVRDARPGAAPLQRNIASLVGGCVIAIGCCVLFLLVASEVAAVTWSVIAVAVVFGGAVGAWIRLADL